ncbi:hypothetical protein P7C70_g1729, partial [Phenoliferia sp. Uapishka_3]
MYFLKTPNHRYSSLPISSTSPPSSLRSLPPPPYERRMSLTARYDAPSRTPSPAYQLTLQIELRDVKTSSTKNFTLPLPKTTGLQTTFLDLRAIVAVKARVEEDRISDCKVDGMLVSMRSTPAAYGVDAGEMIDGAPRPQPSRVEAGAVILCLAPPHHHHLVDTPTSFIDPLAIETCFGLAGEMTTNTANYAEGLDGSDSDLDSSNEDSKDAQGKGKGKSAKERKTRSSKASAGSQSASAQESRYLARPRPDHVKIALLSEQSVHFRVQLENASLIRGPPKGYIEAIESRLHRMEALLGGLLQNDDPRASLLLGELIGDEEAREILTKDLREAAAALPSSKPRKSWKKASDIIPNPPPPTNSHSNIPIVSRGFSSSVALNEAHPLPVAAPQNWFSGEELAFSTNMQGVSDSSMSGLPPVSFTLPNNTLGLDQSMGTYRTLVGGRDSDDERSRSGIDIPISDSFGLESNLHPRSASGGSGSLPRMIPQHLNADQGGGGSSPRQRRRLNGGASPAGSNSSLPGGRTSFSYQQPGKAVLSPNAINHTGQSSYTLSADADLSPAGEPEDGGQGMTELADVVGQLSLNENAEVRYHGRSSGLYLISKSARYKDFFWQLKTENEILKLTDSEDPLPDRQTQQHLLDLYWTYVHPHFPILYKISFMRQYRHSLSNPNSTEPSTPSGQGKVPIVLLLSMFALAARYSDLDPPRSDGKYWTAGQDYMDKAKKVLDYDYGSSKLVSVQALLLMAYREIGTGGMSASWLFTGMGSPNPNPVRASFHSDPLLRRIPGQNSESSPTHFPSHSICTTSANAIATFDEALARPAKQYLSQCMNALKEMEVIWGSALRQFELLHGLVDLRDSELSAELNGERGTKRPAEASGTTTPISFDDLAPANFHSRPLAGPSNSGSRSRGSSTQAPSISTRPTELTAPLPPLNTNTFNGQSFHPAPVQGFEGGHQTYNIINHDLSHFGQDPHGNFQDILQGFLSPTDSAGHQPPPGSSADFQNSAFFGMPLGVDSDQWYGYAGQAFGTNMSPDSGGPPHHPPS